MPELPEVETMVRGIRPSLEGWTIHEVRACECRCRPMTIEPELEVMAARVRGQKVVRVRRRAKRVVMELASGDAFVIEPRMTGLMLVHEPPDQEHLRVEWRMARGRQRASVWFWDQRGLGTLRLIDRTACGQLLAVGKLGPDALEMSAELWAEVCSATATPIKVALLDQKRVAGIGNLYASEILHRARINPHAPACAVTRPQLVRLDEATRRILEEAIRYEGSTLSDGTYRNTLNQSGGYQNAHRVYDREGQPCLTCERAAIVRIVQSQRSTFYCPHCQKPGNRMRKPGTQ